MPLPLFFFGNLVFGLGGTQAVRYFLFNLISILIFHVVYQCLRHYVGFQFGWQCLVNNLYLSKISILWLYFNKLLICFFWREKQPLIAQASVYLMVIGALIASGDDLTFNWFGYLFLTINNFCTTAQGVVIKQKLVNKVN